MLFCINLPKIIYIGPPCGNITSYRFFQNAAAATQYYFQFCVCWCCCLQKAKICQQDKFRKHTSIQGWDITTSGLEKQTSAILKFYFRTRFQSRTFRRNRRVNLHQDAEFRPNWTMHCGFMMSYRFSRCCQSAMLYLLLGNGRPPTKCLSWSELRLQIACSSD